MQALPLAMLDPGTSLTPTFEALRRSEHWVFRPTRRTREVHDAMTRNIREAIPEYQFATAARRGMSPRIHVLRHQGNRYLYVTDLSNAYGSVRVSDLARILWRRVATCR